MSDKKKQAQLAFKAICKALDDNNWRYDKDTDKMSIVCGARGDDLPIPLRITVDGDRALLRMSSYVNSIPESKRMEAAAVICTINYRLVSGCFDYDIRDGEVSYRQSISFADSVLSDAMCEYLLFCVCSTVDEYNDKIADYIGGKMSFEEIMRKAFE